MTPPPKLTRPEMARLIEIGKFPDGIRSRSKPTTTDRLLANGLITAMSGQDWVPGWMAHPVLRLTDAGRAVLAGLPEEMV